MGGAQGTSRKAGIVFCGSGAHSLRLGGSLWTAIPMPCRYNQLLRGVHTALITEEEGDRSVSVYENLVFLLPFLYFSCS